LGHGVVVATMMHDRHLLRRTIVKGVEVKRFPGIGPRAYRIPIGLFRYLRQEGSNFDIVHAHNYGGLALLLAVLACHKRSVITLYYHGHGNSPLAELMHWVYDPFASSVLRRAGGVVCLSSGEAQLAAQNLGIARDSITIIPSIIPIPEAITLADKQQALDAQGIQCLFLSVGRLMAYKRIDRIIAALPYLPENYALAVIGTGPEQKKLEKLVERLGVRDRVWFRGAVRDEELRHWYLRARVVVSLSEGESFGRVVVEALASHCPVVCSDIPAFQDFANEFPCAVSLVSPEMQGREIAEVLRGVAARPVGEPVNLQRYTWPEITRELLKVYTNVAGRAAAGRDRKG
jgi:glycosyltransferase involved in cell wall biosynthesis